MSYEEFTVTKINLHGPDGQSISKPMSVPEALDWLRGKAGYDEVKIGVEMDLKEIEIQVAQIVGKEFEKGLKWCKAELLKETAKLRAEAREAESVLKDVDRDLPGIRSMLQALKWQRDEDARVDNAERRNCEKLETLRKEMLVPGRTCGSCAGKLYDKGIAISPNVSGYLCAPCGEQQTGEKFVVGPERRDRPFVFVKKLTAQHTGVRFLGERIGDEEEE